MISVTVQHKGNEKKDTARNILNKKEFVVHIVDEDNVVKLIKTAANLPSNESEVLAAGLTRCQVQSLQFQVLQKQKSVWNVRWNKVVELVMKIIRLIYR